MSKEWEFGRNWQSWVPLYGFSSLQDQRQPQDFERVWIMRPEWTEPKEIRPRDLPPWFNVAGMWWTPDPPLTNRDLGGAKGGDAPFRTLTCSPTQT